MSSSKKKKNRDNGINRTNNQNNRNNLEENKKLVELNKNEVIEDECDKILEELDEIEKNKTKIRSKAKDLIQGDKQAIREMQKKQQMDQGNDKDAEVETDEDELDYLDDEAPELDKTNKREIEADEDHDSEDENEPEMDFIASLNKEDDKVNIRKREPKRLKNLDGSTLVGKIKILANENRKNFIVGTSVAMLLIIMFIALIVDSKNGNDSSTDAKFIKMDTKPMMEVVNNYYASLVEGDTQKVRTFLVDSKDLTDDAINEKCNEAKTYSELISDSFTITDCNVQKGLKNKEYIAYMKFQIKIKSIDTPAVGIFTCYVVNTSKEKNKPVYKISTEVNDKKSEQYKYIIKMKNCKVVKDLFDKVDKELAQACEKDANLKSIVDALKNNGTTNNTETNQTTTAAQSTEPQTTAAAN